MEKHPKPLVTRSTTQSRDSTQIEVLATFDHKIWSRSLEGWIKLYKKLNSYPAVSVAHLVSASDIFTFFFPSSHWPPCNIFLPMIGCRDCSIEKWFSLNSCEKILLYQIVLSAKQPRNDLERSINKSQLHQAKTTKVFSTFFKICAKLKRILPRFSLWQIL